MDQSSRFYERVESLERNQERLIALVNELQRRMDSVEIMREDVRSMEQAMARLEGKLEAQFGSLTARMNTWHSLVWTILGILLGGIVSAGFELFKR